MISSAQLRAALDAATSTIAAHADELSALDSAIGDGDHGANMKRGFDAVAAEAASLAGKPLPDALKAIGTNRVRFGEIIDILKASDFGIIASTRSTVELQNIFDSMSFNKARVLLTYWDWAVLKSGPYAPAN